MRRTDQEIHLKLLRHLVKNPQVSQRELAEHLGVSLGKAHYCLHALVDKGLVKTRTASSSANQRSCLYLLSPKGLRVKTQMGLLFLQRKIEQRMVLDAEINELQEEFMN